ncbi:MAG TPA: hypothetical protein DEP84_04220 [Chloroflexi bacterium]|nr:hypothetical protein [Chloroflexota bacterium]
MPVKMQYLGWSAFLFTASTGQRIIVDPYLEGHADQGVARSPLQRNELYPIDAVVVSHAARDHIGEAVAIAKESGAMLVGNIDVRLTGLNAGLPAEQTAVMVSGATYDAEWGRVKALAAHHISFTELNGQYLTGQPLCYILDFGDVRVFHGGDTSISYDFQLFGQLYRPDVALLGVDGVLFEKRRAIVELDPLEATEMTRMLGVSLAVPMHYRAASGKAQEFVQLVQRMLHGVDAIVMEPGETIELGTTPRYRRGA